MSEKCKWDIWQMQMRYPTNASKISDKPNNILSDKGKLNFWQIKMIKQVRYIEQMQIVDHYKKRFEIKMHCSVAEMSIFW